MDLKLPQNFFFAIIFLILIVVSFLIIKPFLTAILTGMVFSYIFYPLYLKINKKIAKKNVSSFVTCIIVVVIITLPLFFMLNSLSKEAYATYILSRQKLATGFVCEPAENPICKIVNIVSEMVKEPKIRYYFDAAIKETTTKITDSASNILFSIPVFLLDLFVMFFVIFFLFKDGNVLISKIEGLMPLKTKYKKRVFVKLDEMAYAVIYGSIIIAVIQGTLGGIGFLIFGLPSPLLWGFVMIFASLLPYVGSTIIWLPAALMLVFNGYLNMDNPLIIKGALFILYGIFVVGSIDNILKPKIIGSKGGLHPVLVLLGVLGGLKFLGFIGVIIGPMILAMLATFIRIYEEEK